MKKLNRIILIMLLLFGVLQLYSCITSCHSLFTPSTIITDNRITGEWKTAKGLFNVQTVANSKDSDALKDIPKQDIPFYSKFYIIDLQSGEFNYSWVAGIVNINNEEFISITGDECINSTDDNVYPRVSKRHEYLDAYTLAKLVWKNKNEIELRFLNGDYIRQNIFQNKMRVKYEYDNLYNTFVITASTDEMVEFLKKYGNDEKLYSQTYSITLKKQS